MYQNSNALAAARSRLTPLFHIWWRMRRGMTLGVRGVARDQEGRVMLVRHGYTPGWHFPGGGVEHGETAGDAIAKEMQEEAGIRPIAAPRLIAIFASHRAFPNDHVLLFDISAWDAVAPTASSREIAERGFFALNALPAGVSPATRRRIAELFEGAPHGADW